MSHSRGWGRWAQGGEYVLTVCEHLAAVSDFGITQEELTELALAADPDTPISPDAVAIDVHSSQFSAALPLWYMPPVVRSGGGRWRRPVVLAVVAAFLLIDALGLCNTYGVLSL